MGGWLFGFNLHNLVSLGITGYHRAHHSEDVHFTFSTTLTITFIEHRDLNIFYISFTFTFSTFIWPLLLFHFHFPPSLSLFQIARLLFSSLSDRVAHHPCIKVLFQKTQRWKYDKSMVRVNIVNMINVMVMVIWIITTLALFYCIQSSFCSKSTRLAVNVNHFQTIGNTNWIWCCCQHTLHR